MMMKVEVYLQILDSEQLNDRFQDITCHALANEEFFSWRNSTLAKDKEGWCKLNSLPVQDLCACYYDYDLEREITIYKMEALINV